MICYQDRSRTAAEILSYLSTHPDVTHDGIGQWWRRQKKTDLSPLFLKEVLSDLITQGLIERSEENGAVRYHSRHTPK